MRTLTYSPSVEAYACHVGRGGEKSYYDLSADLVSCSISLTMDGSGTMAAVLQNPHNKYAGLLMPMDLVCAYATKVGKVRMFTGYINSVDEARMYGGDITVKATDAVYRLNKLYWDSGLATSRALMGYRNDKVGFAGTVYAMLTRGAGMDPSMVHIGDIPGEMQEFAFKMWAADARGAADMLSRRKDFMAALGNAGPSLSAGAQGSGAGGQGYTQGLTPGGSIDVPTNIQTATATYTIYVPEGWGYTDGSTRAVAAGTGQEYVHEKWVASGCAYESHGIATLGGRYLVAMSPKFGTSGDMVDVEYDNGLVLQCTMADEKGGDAQSEWGHVYDGLAAVMEFEISMQAYREHGSYGSLAVDAWFPDIVGAKVVKVTSYGRL